MGLGRPVETLLPLRRSNLIFTPKISCAGTRTPRKSDLARRGPRASPSFKIFRNRADLQFMISDASRRAKKDQFQRAVSGLGRSGDQQHGGTGSVYQGRVGRHAGKSGQGRHVLRRGTLGSWRLCGCQTGCGQNRRRTAQSLCCGLHRQMARVHEQQPRGPICGIEGCRQKAEYALRGPDSADGFILGGRAKHFGGFTESCGHVRLGPQSSAAPGHNGSIRLADEPGIHGSAGGAADGDRPGCRRPPGGGSRSKSCAAGAAKRGCGAQRRQKDGLHL